MGRGKPAHNGRHAPHPCPPSPTLMSSDSGRLVVRPSEGLHGEVPIAGAKNSVLKLMAATVLAEGTHVLHNVPDLTDVTDMAELLSAMGLVVDPRRRHPHHRTPGRDRPRGARTSWSSACGRPSWCWARCSPRSARPGWRCPAATTSVIRPIDMHLASLESLGASFTSSHGFIEGRADQLHGTSVVLDFPSVGATENLLMAAVLAKGTTTIDNTAREPEIADLAAMLNRMGAQVVGAGSSTIEIEGVAELSPVEHTVIPDRIEAATFLAVVGVAGGEVTLLGARADHMDMLIQKLGTMGMRISPTPEGIWAMSKGELRSTDISTLPYPGVATDYKPLLVAMLTVADGIGIVTENIFGGRFRYISELVRMGADIRTEGHHAVVRGIPALSGAPVRASDIRAGAALVIAGIRAEGETLISGAGHLDRGYERFDEKLRDIGVDVTRLP